MLGSGAVCPFNTDRDPVQMLATLTRFYAHESCGQCTPCREGTGYADRVLKQIVKKKVVMVTLISCAIWLINSTARLFVHWPLLMLGQLKVSRANSAIILIVICASEAKDEERDLVTLRPGGFM